MDLNEAEIQVCLEAAGKRYKWLRSTLMDASRSAQEKAKWEENIVNLDSAIKKLLSYQREQFPEATLDAEEELLESETSEEAIDYSPFSALIVEDQAAERLQLVQLLSDHGFIKLEQADDGHTAIAIIKERVTPFDVILCDLNMPTITGLDLLKLIRKEERYAELPFILLSEKGKKEQLQEAMDAGVTGYIVKPVSDQNLLPKLARILPN